MRTFILIWSQAILQPATPRDLPLINGWLVLPDMRRWWGNPMDNQREMRMGIYCHDDVGRVYLILDRFSRPVGLVSMIHAKAMASARIEGSSHLPENSWEIGILIAKKRDRRRGLGIKALIEAQINVAGISNDPIFAWIEKENVASLATFAKLGYVRVHKPEIAHYSSALLRYDHQGA